MKTMKNMPEVVKTAIELSECGQYRYTLLKSTVEEPDLDEVCLWIMLNSSTATAYRDDPTARKCQKFTKRMGLKATLIMNLFALRSTDPAMLTRHEEPIGEHNYFRMGQMIARYENVVVAWGSFNHPMLKTLARRVYNLITEQGRKPLCLGVNRDGMPKHPLYVADKTTLINWRMP